MPNARPPRNRSPHYISDHKIIAWLAGYLEGEGSFLRTVNRIFVSVQTTDRDIAQRVATLLNGTVYLTGKRKPHHKQAYMVRLTGARAEYCMRLVRPYMGIRRGARIDECLEVAESRRLGRSAERTAVSDAELSAAYEATPRPTLRELSRKLGLGRVSVARRLNRLGYAVSSDVHATLPLHAKIDYDRYPCLGSSLDVTLAWLAGLLEGEGYFTEFQRSPGFRVHMTDRDVVEQVCLVTHTTIVEELLVKAEWKPLYRATVYGERARSFMRLMYPYLGERRRQCVAELLSAHARYRSNLAKERDEHFNQRYDRESICLRWAARVKGESLVSVSKELGIGVESLRRRLTEWGVYEGKPSVTTRVSHRAQQA